MAADVEVAGGNAPAPDEATAPAIAQAAVTAPDTATVSAQDRRAARPTTRDATPPEQTADTTLPSLGATPDATPDIATGTTPDIVADIVAEVPTPLPATASTGSPPFVADTSGAAEAEVPPCTEGPRTAATTTALRWRPRRRVPVAAAAALLAVIAVGAGAALTPWHRPGPAAAPQDKPLASDRSAAGSPTSASPVTSPASGGTSGAAAPTSDPAGTVGGTTTPGNTGRSTTGDTGRSTAGAAAPAGSSGTPAAAADGAAGPPVAAGAAFATTAGPTCTQSGARSTSAYDSSSGDGWHSATTAMWTGDGCGAGFRWTKLANASDTNRWDEDLDYYFGTGLSGGARCTVSVYIPNSSYAAGTAHYWVTNQGPENPSYDNRIATFAVDQSAHRGGWVTAGTYRFSGTRVTVELDDNGSGATIVGSDVAVSC